MSNWTEEVKKISLMKNVNFLIYRKFPSVPSWSIPFCLPQVWPPIQAGKENKAFLLKIQKNTAITALSRSGYSHLQLTFSKYLRGGKRWGILVVKGASSPLRWSLCTWKWSWAETSDQEQSRTGRWGWQHRCHLQKKEILEWGKTSPSVFWQTQPWRAILWFCCGWFYSGLVFLMACVVWLSIILLFWEKWVCCNFSVETVKY